METKFFGSYNELDAIIEKSGYLGAWNEEAPENKPTFRFNNGAILNWWPVTGTVQFQGKMPAKEEVKEVIVPMLFKKNE